VLESITSGLVAVSSRNFSLDVPRGRGDKVGTIFGSPPPKKWLFSFAGQKLKMSRTEKRSNLGVLMAAGVTSGV